MFAAILTAAIIGRVMQDAKSSIYKMWVVFIVGTFFHELAHFTVGLLIMAMPYKFSILPQRADVNGVAYTMGHVKFLNLNWFNVFWTSMAPLLLLPLSFYVYKYFFVFFDYTLLNFFIWIYLIVSLVFSSIPSSVDFRNVFSGNIVSNLFGGLIIFGVIYYLNSIGVLEWIYLKMETMIFQ